MRKKITNANIDSLPMSETWDTVFPGLVHWRGKMRRTWFLRAHVDNQEHRVKLGTFPALSIKEARDAARETLKRLEAGLPAEAAPPVPVVREAALPVEQFLNEYGCYRRIKERNIKTLPATLRLLEKGFGDYLKIAAADITKADVTRIRDKIARRAPVASNRFLGHAGAVWKWGAREDKVPENFFPLIEKIGPERARDRVLSDDEIVQLWQVTRGSNYPGRAAFDRLVRFLLATAVRKGEVVNAEWRDVQNGVLTIRDNKASRPFLLPITPLAAECMNGRKHDLVFYGRSGRITAFTDHKAALDKRLQFGEPWRLHDLRATAATGMSKLKVPRFIVSRALNHADRSIKGKHYDRHEFLDEKREALEKWNAHILGLVGIFT